MKNVVSDYSILERQAELWWAKVTKRESRAVSLASESGANHFGSKIMVTMAAQQIGSALNTPRVDES